jgi:hypothetical protein
MRLSVELNRSFQALANGPYICKIYEPVSEKRQCVDVGIEQKVVVVSKFHSEELCALDRTW